MDFNTPTPSLKLQNLSKVLPHPASRSEVQAVADVTLTVYNGEFLTLLGPSGCGKHTLLRLIAGLEDPSSGQIILDGQDITDLPANRRDLVLISRNCLIPELTVYKNVADNLRGQRLSRKAIRKMVEDVLETVGLVGFAQHRPDQLSGRQQQRAALARALVLNPRLLLINHPLAIDPRTRLQLRSEFRHLQRRLHTTTLYVTDDPVEAMALSNRIAVMDEGQVEQVGTPSDIYRYPHSRFVASFTGPANFVYTRAEALDGQVVTVDILGRKVNVYANPRPRVGDDLLAVLRPESLSLRGEDAFLKQVEVQQVLYLGGQIEYTVDVDGVPFTVLELDTRAHITPVEGQITGLDFAVNAVHLLPA